MATILLSSASARPACASPSRRSKHVSAVRSWSGARWARTPASAPAGSRLGSLLVCGAALFDIRATQATIQDHQVVLLEHALDVVSYGEVPVTYTLAATRGQALIVGTVAGTVSPAGATPDTRPVMGYCAQDSVSAGAVGMAFIKPSGG